MFILFLLIIISLAVLAHFFPYPPKMGNQHFDAILVLGCPAEKEGSVSKPMKERVDKAIELYQMHYADKIIFSGSHVKNEYIEAEVMYHYAAQTIDSSHLLMETQARNTYENFKYASSFPYQKILVVTSPSHVRRAALFARKFYSDASFAKCKPHDPVHYYIWEYTRMWVCLYYEWKLNRR